MSLRQPPASLGKFSIRMGLHTVQISESRKHSHYIEITINTRISLPEGLAHKRSLTFQEHLAMNEISSEIHLCVYQKLDLKLFLNTLLKHIGNPNGWEGIQVVPLPFSILISFT